MSRKNPPRASCGRILRKNLDKAENILYNTIEVRKMKIERIDIKYTRENSLTTKIDGLCHTKILPRLSLVQATEGSYTVQLGNQKPQSTGCGGFFIAPSGTQQTITHSVDPESKKMSGRWIFIDAVINKAYRPDFLYDFPTVVPDEQAKKLNALFDSLFSADTIFDRYSCYYQILKILLEELATPKNTRIHSSMQSALEHIQKNFAEEIRIEDLAKCAHRSPSNLFAVFKKEFGISPITYVNQYRLSMAAEYLLRKDASVSEIATMTGFHDALYFSKMFHKMYQVSPREYRKQNKV